MNHNHRPHQVKMPSYKMGVAFKVMQPIQQQKIQQQRLVKQIPPQKSIVKRNQLYGNENG